MKQTGKAIMKYTGGVFDWDGTTPYGKVTDALGVSPFWEVSERAAEAHMVR